MVVDLKPLRSVSGFHVGLGPVCKIEQARQKDWSHRLRARPESFEAVGVAGPEALEPDLLDIIARFYGLQ
jgi:hypothetical protein